MCVCICVSVCVCECLSTWAGEQQDLEFITKYQGLLNVPSPLLAVVEPECELRPAYCPGISGSSRLNKRGQNGLSAGYLSAVGGVWGVIAII